MTRDDFRRRADAVRAIPLEVVLSSWDAVRDRCDKSRWHTPRGPLSVSGTKFYNWHTCQGGGGAIDLAMHLGGWDARQAMDWLERHLGCHLAGAHPGCRYERGCRACLCISTAGVRPDAPWLYPLLARGYQIYCGFDADEPGETASRQMITRHRLIQRLRPSGHDWNDVLTTPSK